MAVIEVVRLTKDYGHNRGVFDVSFQVAEGEVYGFLGPNGAGKTTTIRHIMGFSRPQQGTVKVNGLDSWKNASEVQRSLGYLPGEMALPETMGGTVFIRMMAELRGMTDMTRTRQLMERFDLDPSGSLKRMSLGMKRKLAIVTAFMHDPAVLVLDEPTSGLDPLMQNEFIAFIKEEKKRGKTILLSSHMFREVEAACDHITIIKDGRIVSRFAAEDFRNNGDKTFVITFKSAAQFEGYARKAKEHPSSVPFTIDAHHPDKQQTTVTVKPSSINAFIAFFAAYDLQALAERKPSLEDHFMQFYDRREAKEGKMEETEPAEKAAMAEREGGTPRGDH